MEAAVRVQLFGGVRVGAAGTDVSVSAPVPASCWPRWCSPAELWSARPNCKELLWRSEGTCQRRRTSCNGWWGRYAGSFKPELSASDAGEVHRSFGQRLPLDPSRIRSDVEECEAAVAVGSAGFRRPPGSGTLPPSSTSSLSRASGIHSSAMLPWEGAAATPGSPPSHARG